MTLNEEQHESIQEITARWGVSDETGRREFAEEPGVLKLYSPSRVVNGKIIRGYCTMRVPKSVSARVHARLCATKVTPKKKK